MILGRKGEEVWNWFGLVLKTIVGETGERVEVDWSRGRWAKRGLSRDASFWLGRFGSRKRSREVESHILGIALRERIPIRRKTKTFSIQQRREGGSDRERGTTTKVRFENSSCERPLRRQVKEAKERIAIF